MRSTSSLSLSLLEVDGGRSGFGFRPRGFGGGFSAGFLPRGGFLTETSESESEEDEEDEEEDADLAAGSVPSLAPSEPALESESEADGTFFLRPPRGPRRGARATAFFSGVKSWSLVFSDSDELSEFSSSEGDTLARSRSLEAFRARLDRDIFRADGFRFRPLLSLLLSESESLSILSLAAAAVTAVTAMMLRSSSSSASLPPAGSASGASLSEELSGGGAL